MEALLEAGLCSGIKQWEVLLAGSAGSASCQWLWGFCRVGFGDVTSMDRTGRGCLAGLQLVFFCWGSYTTGFCGICDKLWW